MKIKLIKNIINPLWTHPLIRLNTISLCGNFSRFLGGTHRWVEGVAWDEEVMLAFEEGRRIVSKEEGCTDDLATLVTSSRTYKHTYKSKTNK